MGAAEHIEGLLEIAVVRQSPPVSRKERPVAGMRDGGLLEHGNSLGALARRPERLAVSQRRVRVFGIGAVARAIKSQPAGGFGAAALLVFIAERACDVRQAISLATAQRKNQ